MYIWFKYKKGELVKICFKERNVNKLKKQVNTMNICNLYAKMVIDKEFVTSYDKPVVVETGKL